MGTNRRAFFGAVAQGAGGMAMLAKAASAAPAGFIAPGKPGDGGFGRNAVQLPAGMNVAYHDPQDVGEMPNFVFSLDGAQPKITTGGWAKESTQHELPIMAGLAGIHMFLDPGASRELHWHAMAAEWAIVISGRCQTVVIDPNGETEINNFEPGDLWYFPKGHGHSIQTIGDAPCHFLLSFDNGAISEHATFSITDWIDTTPKDLLAQNFGIEAAAFAPFPKGETYIQSGPILTQAMAVDAPWPRDSTHKFALLKEARAKREFAGGSFHLATVDEWPASKSMSGGVIVIKPGQIKELHWHPNANEFQYVVSGTGQMVMFGSGGRSKVANVKPGDSAYIPAGYGHGIINTGSVDLEIIQTWDSGKFEEITLRHWVETAPKYLLSNNFVGVPDATLEKLIKA